MKISVLTVFFAGLKKLTLDGAIILNENDVPLPITLHSITFYDIPSAESLLSRLLHTSHTIDTINFQLHEQKVITISSITSLLRYFGLHGSKLTTLKFTNFDHFIIPMLLAQTPSLLHLFLESHEDDMVHTIKYIQSLPINTRPSSLAIGQFVLDDCIEPNFLLPLIKLPQLSQLKTLWHWTSEYEYGDYYEEGRLEEEIDEGEIIKIAFDKSVKLCKDKGIRLSFYMEHYERKINELYKQRLYEARQKVLDEERLKEVSEVGAVLEQLKI